MDVEETPLYEIKYDGASEYAPMSIPNMLFTAFLGAVVIVTIMIVLITLVDLAIDYFFTDSSQAQQPQSQQQPMQTE